jgi:TolB protein
MKRLPLPQFLRSLGLIWALGLLLISLLLSLSRGGEVRGAWLFYVSGVDGQIYRRWLDPDRRLALPQQRLTDDLGVKQHLSASPDGQWLVFSTFRDGYFNLHRIRFDGQMQGPLLQREVWDTVPAWSPDGEWIAFASDISQEAELYRIRPDGRGLEPLTDNDSTDTYPSWSPDGQRLLFQSTPPNGQTDLYWTDLAGGKWHRLTYQPGFDGQGQWSPDGEGLVFTSQMAEDSNYHIYWMDSQGGNLRRLTPAGSPEGFYDPRWSPDGQWVTFWGGHPGRFMIYFVRPDGSDFFAMGRPGSYLGPTWAPLIERPWRPGWPLGAALAALWLVYSAGLKFKVRTVMAATASGVKP